MITMKFQGINITATLALLAIPMEIKTQSGESWIFNEVNMKFLLSIVILLITGLSLRSQMSIDPVEGSVSYITSQSVYVKFKSTQGIKAGDTLYMEQEGKLIPVLTVTSISSISCVCVPVSAIKVKVADKIIAKPGLEPGTEIKGGSEENIQDVVVVPADSDTLKQKLSRQPKQKITGRFSIASYSNFTSADPDLSQRMRYTFSLKGNNLGNTRLSAETYLSFAHSNTNWDEVQENLFRGLKVYNLALRYDFKNNLSVLFGRKINPRISNVGAIDGLQVEKTFGSFTLGAFGGSRPDYRDYGFHFGLMQYGAYLGHDFTPAKRKGNMQTSVAVAEQTNNGFTDRRFAYFQHANSLIKNLYFFGSVEMDLYKKLNGASQSTLDLSNLYLMLRYQIIKPLSVSVSYNTRQNIVYYETYKDYIERLIEQETMQGYRIMASYRILKNLTFGAKAGYRYRTDDPKPSRDLYGYVNINRVPGLNASANLSVTILESSYLKGNIYSLGLNRDLIPGKVSAGLYYRYVGYDYVNIELLSVQHVGELDLTWRIIKKLSLSVYYEGTFETSVTFNRIYTNVSYRF